MIRISALTIILLCFLLASYVYFPNRDQPSSYAPDHIRSYYHGLLLDQNREVIDLTPGNASSMQSAILDHLSGFANKDILSRADEPFLQLDELALNEDDQLIATDIKIAWLLNQLDDDELIKVFDWRRRAILEQIYFLEKFKTYSVRPEIMELVERLKLRNWIIFDPAGGIAYLDDCEAAAVPKPAVWPGTAWKFNPQKDVLDPAKTNPNFRNEIYRFTDPGGKGVCMAIRRRQIIVQSTTTTFFTKAVGIICQSRQTGKACFWDNITVANGKPKQLEGPNISLDPRYLMNGNNLTSNCTWCHRGTNAFLIYPQSALSHVIGFDTSHAQRRYQPVSTQVSWSNPGPQTLPTPGSIAGTTDPQSYCNGCHEIGALKGSKSYCDIIQNTLVNYPMPTKFVVNRNPKSNFRDWNHPVAAFKDHIDEIRRICSLP